MPYEKYVKLKGFTKVLINLTSIPDKILIEMQKDAGKITAYMEEELKTDIAKEGFDYEELRKMGHPYGKGDRGDRKPARQSVPYSVPIIQTQSGHLKSKIKCKTELSKTKGKLTVYVHKADVPYIDYLIDGTSKMVGRNVFGYTWKRIKHKCLNDFKKIINNGIAKADGT